MIAPLDQCRTTLGHIREDCTNDAAGLDGVPLTGLGVGTQFGNTLAMIDALAHVVDELIVVIDREVLS